MNSWFTVSPLNYIGGKARILDQLLPVFPEHISTFVDLFCGGCNVGINTQADNYIYNDCNRELIGLLKMFLRLNTNTILKRMDEIVEHYGFSKTKDHNFAYYGGNPMKGVSRYNKEPFLQLRQDYNNSPRNNQHYIMLYALVVFGFNNQMRFNDKGEYNLPVGKRDFNDVIRRKLQVFVDKLRCRYIMLSYNNNCQKLQIRSNAKISDDEIMRILGKRGDVRVFTQDFKPFSAGRGENVGNQERLFLCAVQR